MSIRGLRSVVVGEGGDSPVKRSGGADRHFHLVHSLSKQQGRGEEQKVKPVRLTSLFAFFPALKPHKITEIRSKVSIIC